MSSSRWLRARFVLPYLAMGGGLIGLGYGFSAQTTLAHLWNVEPLLLVGAAACYLIAHGFRFLRSVIVLGAAAQSVRTVALAHLVSAPWSGLLPFKSGEVARVLALGRASGSAWVGLQAVWVERAFDACFLVATGFLALYWVAGAGSLVGPVLVLATAFLGLTLLSVLVLPANLLGIKHWLIRRYSTDWSLWGLRGIDRILEGVRSLKERVEGRFVTLGVVTLAIWGLELLGLWILLPPMRFERREAALEIGLFADLSVGLLWGLSDRLGSVSAPGLNVALHHWAALVAVSLIVMALVGLPWSMWHYRSVTRAAQGVGS
ncbi:MAG: hypothetical protein EA397_20285 [Deltaproteobacteria bacterium]|nr:MAG: hypothetical protein EA397_20285 [Deltaproteobacteria bacterium]